MFLLQFYFQYKIILLAKQQVCSLSMYYKHEKYQRTSYSIKTKIDKKYSYSTTAGNAYTIQII